MTRRQDNTIIDADAKCIRCTKCKTEVPTPLGDVAWVCAVMRAYAKAHRACIGGAVDHNPRGEAAWMTTIVPKDKRRGHQ